MSNRRSNADGRPCAATAPAGQGGWPIVHVGYHKTATTWFQECFYPATRHRYVPRQTVYDALVAPDAFAFCPDGARQRLGAAADAIYCEEELSGYLHNGGLSGFASREVASRLQRTVPGARIIIFIRDQVAMAAASYLQYVRVGGTHGPRRYLLPGHYLSGAAADPYKAPRFALEHLAYDRLVRHYTELFGREAVHVFAYEDLKADPAAFARRYAAILGLDVDWETLCLKPRNVSYRRGTVGVTRLLNRFTARAVLDKQYVVHVPGLYSARRWLVERFNRLPGRCATPEELLGPALCAEIAARFAASNRRLADEHGIDLAAHGYSVGPATARPSASNWQAIVAGAQAVACTLAMAFDALPVPDVL